MEELQFERVSMTHQRHEKSHILVRDVVLDANTPDIGLVRILLDGEDMTDGVVMMVNLTQQWLDRVKVLNEAPKNRNSATITDRNGRQMGFSEVDEKGNILTERMEGRIRLYIPRLPHPGYSLPSEWRDYIVETPVSARFSQSGSVHRTIGEAESVERQRQSPRPQGVLIGDPGPTGEQGPPGNPEPESRGVRDIFGQAMGALRDGVGGGFMGAAPDEEARRRRDEYRRALEQQREQNNNTISNVMTRLRQSGRMESTVATIQAQLENGSLSIEHAEAAASQIDSMESYLSRALSGFIGRPINEAFMTEIQQAVDEVVEWVRREGQFDPRVEVISEGDQIHVHVETEISTREEMPAAVREAATTWTHDQFDGPEAVQFGEAGEPDDDCPF